MPPKKQQIINRENPPANLSKHPFFGLKLDENQKEFRDTIWDKNYDIVFCNSVSGTGKTLLAVATAKLLVEYGLYEGLIYIVAPTQSDRNGFLPGGIVEKEAPYYAPLFDALVKIDEQPQKAVKQLGDAKTSNGWIDCRSHVYTRGINFEKHVVIIEESQNFYFDELKRVLTRIHSSCKTICIGHDKQIDLFKNPQNSGFTKYIEHFKGQERCKICELSVNYRGWVSQHADDLIN